MMGANKILQDHIDELTLEKKELYDTITTLILNLKKIEDENIELRDENKNLNIKIRDLTISDLTMRGVIK